MSDLSINASSLLSSLASLGGVQPSSQTSGGSTSTSAIPTASGTQAANFGHSKSWKLQQALQQLRQQNPTLYKQTVTQIAQKLNQAASQATGNAQKFLTSLATAFQNAENGSSVTLPQPPGANSSSSTSSSSTGSSSSSSANAALAAYSAAAQTSAGQQALSALTGSTANSTQNSTAQSALDSIFQIVNGAFSGLAA